LRSAREFLHGALVTIWIAKDAATEALPLENVSTKTGKKAEGFGSPPSQVTAEIQPENQPATTEAVSEDGPRDDGGSRVGRSAGERVRREVWEMFFGATASTGDCPVCGSPVTWKRWQAGHMRAVARGGDNSATNLVVSCGCNQETSVHHVLDYMGLHAAHRVHRLMALVRKLFISRVPKPLRRKLVAVYADQVLIDFVRRYYDPPKLASYQEWLEADSDDLQFLIQ
jgi:hypothetical protein